MPISTTVSQIFRLSYITVTENEVNENNLIQLLYETFRATGHGSLYFYQKTNQREELKPEGLKSPFPTA